MPNDRRLVIAGTIVGGIVAYYAYREYLKHSLIKDYIDEVKSYAAQYASTHNIDVLELAERALRAKEEVIKREGFFGELLTGLAKLGIIAVGGLATYGVIVWIKRRYPPKPPEYICPICRIDLHSEWRLKKHIEEIHRPAGDTSEAQSLFNQLPKWIQDLIIALSGVGEEIKKRWDALPPDTRFALVMAITIVILILVAFSLGIGTPVLISLKRIATLLIV